MLATSTIDFARRRFCLHFHFSLHSCRSVFLWHPQVSFCWDLLPTWGVIEPQKPRHARRNCGSFRARCLELPSHSCWVGGHDCNWIMQKSISAEAAWRDDGTWTSGTDTLPGFFSFYNSFALRDCATAYHHPFLVSCNFNNLLIFFIMFKNSRYLIHELLQNYLQIVPYLAHL